MATPAGLDQLEAIVAHRLMLGGMTREDTQAQLGLVRLCNHRRRALLELELDENDKDLAARLLELRKLMSGKAGNAMRADVAAIPPLEGTDPLREDMAAAPTPARSTEPYRA